ncbi:MAG: hypothetical protein Q7S86_01350 [bacterium]|nr:hypothetical protein [bacterium]
MIDFKMVQLAEEVAVQCPKCSRVLSRGEVIIETDIDGERYVYAELVTCCDEIPMPIPFLFDSPEPVLSYVRQLAAEIQTPADLLNSPFVKKSLLFGP